MAEAPENDGGARDQLASLKGLLAALDAEDLYGRRRRARNALGWCLREMTLSTEFDVNFKDAVAVLDAMPMTETPREALEELREVLQEEGILDG